MEIKLSDMVERYSFCDPASGRQVIKRVRARSAVVTIGVDHLMRFFVLHTFADRCSTDKLIEKLVEIGETYQPRLFGIEANAMQSLFANAMRREARTAKKRIPFIPITQPTKIDKDFRIRAALQPVIASGRLFLQANQIDLRGELLSFPMSPTKDLVDALASAIAMAPNRQTRREKDKELESRLAYLRATGAPLHYIEQVAEGREVAA